MPISSSAPGQTALSEVLSYAEIPSEKTVALLHTSLRGLKNEDVAARRRQYGSNEFAATETTSLKILGRQFRSAFISLLLAAAVLAAILGEALDGGLILLFIIINATLGFFQEYRSEQTLRLLRNHAVGRARVLRDGTTTLIPAPELVPGDIVVVEAGDILPADIRFTDVHDLLIDESVLTGESIAAEKQGAPCPSPPKDFSAATNLGFGGTHVVSGRGQGIVIATGNRSVFGEISAVTVSTERESNFEKGVSQFSRFILRLTVVTLIAVFLAHLAIRHETNIIQLTIFSIALAVSVIPEAMPLVTTFSLTRGARRLARRHVLVKRLAAIEELGGINVLCTDKTGTLTENRLTVVDTYSSNAQALFARAAAGATLSTEKLEPNNSFDLAIWQQLTPEQQQALRQDVVIDELPFDPVRRRNSVLRDVGHERLLVVRGAPEAILPAVKHLPPDEYRDLLAWAARHGRRGNRVLAVATKEMPGATTYEPKDEESGLELGGMLAFADPIKPTTKKTVADAHHLGVTVKILTGDSPEVAGAVAVAADITDDPQKVMAGSVFASLTAEEQLHALETFHVFARVSPSQKHQIVKLLERSHRVGFLGEGINDAPALKTANVGLAVDSAADVARSAADILLLKKNLDTILDGIREGRAVFANTVKYITLTLTSNFGNFYAIAFASLLIEYLPMLPLQILLVNLLSDFPMIAIATDAVDREELRAPRTYDIREIAAVATLLGLISTFFDFIFFAVFRSGGEQVLQTNWFIGSILTELVLLFSLRSKRFFLRAVRPSATVLYLTGIGAVLTILLPFVPFGGSVFGFLRPSAGHMAIILLIVALYFLFTEGMKILYYRHAAHVFHKKEVMPGG